MRYYQLSSPALNRLRSQQKAADAKSIHPVEVWGLTDDHLGQHEFSQELVARREWCKDHCQGEHFIDPICDEKMRLVGRRFRFESVVDAVHSTLR